MQQSPHNMTRVTGTVVTTPIATPGVVNWPGAAQVVGTPVIFSGAGLPTGITAGTVYYVSSAGLSAGFCQLATTLAAAVAGTGSIAFTGTSSGTQYACPETLIAGMACRIMAIFPEVITLGNAVIRDAAAAGGAGPTRHTCGVGMLLPGLLFGGGDSGVKMLNGISVQLTNGADAVNVVWNTLY